MSTKYGIKQGVALEVCEYMFSHFQNIQKCYYYQYPKCDSPSTFGGVWPSEPLELECESCGYFGDDFESIIYFDNNRKKEKILSRLALVLTLVT